MPSFAIGLRLLKGSRTKKQLQLVSILIAKFPATKSSIQLIPLTDRC